MYVHFETWQEVLGWVEATFPGVDTAPTIRRKTVGLGPHRRVGNSDPVVINDVDKYGMTDRVDGKIVRVQAPAGHWRRTVEDVLGDLFKVGVQLRDESASLARTFLDLRRQYERGTAQEWVYERLVQMKTSIELLDVWHDNVWRQYCASRPLRGLDLPERRVKSQNPATT
jgi:hypothetical protein